MTDLSAAEAVFTAALGLADPDERRAYLDRACAEDPLLREAVERLLDAHADLGDFLEPSASTRDADARGPSGLGPGSLLAGRYELIEVIGEGGMGAVWAARQVQPVRRIVAVKLIKAGMDGGRVLARFEAERQALALMDHPNIARVFDGGVAPDGRPFFVMERVDGVPITRYCDERRLTPRERLELFVPVCLAIGHAHQKGVIHRDIKPGNVLIATYDGRAVPKVIDFGVAKAAGGSFLGPAPGTAHGAVVGTPEYMSPEQASLDDPDVDTRSDVYSLGVLLYELLAGSPPISRADLQRAGLLEILRAVREQEPPIPSRRLSTADGLPGLAAVRGTEPRRLAAQIRGELDWIAMKALEKDRTRRYDSAGGLADDVRRHLAGEPVLAAPPGRAYLMRKALRRHRRQALAAGLVLTALVAGIVGTTWGLLRAEAGRAEAERAAAGEARARRAEEAAARAATARAAESAAVLKFLRERVLAAARPEARFGGLGRDVTVLAAMDAAEPAVADAFPEQPGVEAGVRDAFGWTYWHQAEYGRAATQFERALALRRASLGPDHPDALDSGFALASAWFYLPGRLDDVIALEEDLLRRREAAHGPGHPDTEGVRGNLALSYYRAGRLEEALGLAERAYRRLEASVGPDAPSTLGAGTALAIPLSELRPTPETADFFEGLLERMDRILGPEAHDTQSTRSRQARVLSHLGRHAEAVAQWERVLDRWTRGGSRSHPRAVEAMLELARGYRALGRPADSLKLYEERIAATRDSAGTVAGEGGPEIAFAAERVDALIEARRFDQAAAEGRAVLASQRAAYDPGDVRVAATLERIGVAELEAGRAEAAEPVLREGLAIRTGRGPDGWEAAAARALLGRALLALGRLAEAEPLLLEAYEGLTRRGVEIPAAAEDRIRIAADRLIELYAALDRPEDQARWRALRAKRSPR